MHREMLSTTTEGVAVVGSWRPGELVAIVVAGAAVLVSTASGAGVQAPSAGPSAVTGAGKKTQ